MSTKLKVQTAVDEPLKARRDQFHDTLVKDYRAFRGMRMRTLGAASEAHALVLGYFSEGPHAELEGLERDAVIAKMGIAISLILSARTEPQLSHLYYLHWPWN